MLMNIAFFNTLEECLNILVSFHKDLPNKERTTGDKNYVDC